MKSLFTVPIVLLAMAGMGPANAETVVAKGGSVSLDLSSTQMSRIYIPGGKIKSVRSLEDPSGPQVLTQTDDTSGDLFIGFDGDTVGRTFSVFITTDAGQTIQLLLHPTDGPARTVEVVPEARVSTPQMGLPRSNGYTETVTAFMKLMFNGQSAEGVRYEPVNDPGRGTGSLSIRTVGYYHGEGIRGIVLFVTNKDTVPRSLKAEQFLVRRVMAAGVSHEMLALGESARVYIAEEVQ